VKEEAGGYFFLAGPGRPERNEIPERIAFCWTAAGVLPRVLAACMAVPSFASFFKVLSSLELHEAPSFDGRLAIQVSFRDKQLYQRWLRLSYNIRGSTCHLPGVIQRG
jgi:hypothetical protein